MRMYDAMEWEVELTTTRKEFSWPDTETSFSFNSFLSAAHISPSPTLFSSSFCCSGLVEAIFLELHWRNIHNIPLSPFILSSLRSLFSLRKPSLHSTHFTLLPRLSKLREWEWEYYYSHPMFLLLLLFVAILGWWWWWGCRWWTENTARHYNTMHLCVKSSVLCKLHSFPDSDCLS